MPATTNASPMAPRGRVSTRSGRSNHPRLSPSYVNIEARPTIKLRVSRLTTLHCFSLRTADSGVTLPEVIPHLSARNVLRTWRVDDHEPIRTAGNVFRGLQFA